MTAVTRPEKVTALLTAHAQTAALLDVLAGNPDLLDDMKVRLQLAENAVRLAAATDPRGVVDALGAAEMAAWLHDPTLYRTALYNRGPGEVRRIMAALTPAADLYAEVAAVKRQDLLGGEG